MDMPLQTLIRVWDRVRVLLRVCEFSEDTVCWVALWSTPVLNLGTGGNGAILPHGQNPYNTKTSVFASCESLSMKELLKQPLHKMPFGK